jgi:tRNA pseudouridine synthase 9
LAQIPANSAARHPGKGEGGKGGEAHEKKIYIQKDAILRGAVTVNGKPVAGPSTIIHNGDLITHTLHRHEPPVTAQPVGIVHEDDDLLVINKPAGVPVHPTGRYNYNTLVEILRAERGGVDWHPLPVNRLDRLTSGVMFLGKHARAAQRVARQIMARAVRKEYVARVRGRFPDGEVVCAQPILLISPKLGLNRVRADGKEATTVFRRLAYYPPPGASARTTTLPRGHSHSDGEGDGHASSSGASSGGGSGGGSSRSSDNDTHHNAQNGIVADGNDSDDSNVSDDNNNNNNNNENESGGDGDGGYSIVQCLPVTGRTHQIRVHLQFLGHPIANDPIYANQRVWGPRLGRRDATGATAGDEDVIARLSRMGKDEVAEAEAYHRELCETYAQRKAEKMSGARCAVCATELYTEPGAHELGIYLHARRYAGEDAERGAWSYEAPLPAWALPPASASAAPAVSVCASSAADAAVAAAPAALSPPAASTPADPSPVAPMTPVASSPAALSAVAAAT